MSGNCELGRGLRRREKNATEGGAGRFEKPAPDARAAPPEAHESLIGRKTVEEVPLTELSSGKTFKQVAVLDGKGVTSRSRVRFAPVEATHVRFDFGKNTPKRGLRLVELGVVGKQS